ncbi:MAG: hypothetical protein AAF074_13795 [Pseudomonadota bacterium]
MIFIEIAALGGMLWLLWRAVGLARRYTGELLLPILLHLCTAAMLGFAAFGGESGLITDWRTMLERAAIAAVLGGLLAGYWVLIRRAKAKAGAERRDGERP